LSRPSARRTHAAHLRGGCYELVLRGATIDVEVCLAHAETGRRALAEGRAIDAERVLRLALDQWRWAPLGDVTESMRLQEEPGLAELHRAVRRSTSTKTRRDRTSVE
jgi:hypothetical protein